MRKNGFTLIEILISLGIIGVIAAIFMRLMTNAVPDLDKASFLRAYLTTKAVVSDMINDPSLYPDEYGRKDENNNDMYGFANTLAPTYGEYGPNRGYSAAQLSGSNKFKTIFADKLGIANGGYSNRDGVYYSISDSGNTKTITVTSKENVTLGRFTVDLEGGVTCASNLGYCNDITNLKKKMN